MHTQLLVHIFIVIYSMLNPLSCCCRRLENHIIVCSCSLCIIIWPSYISLTTSVFQCFVCCYRYIRSTREMVDRANGFRWYSIRNLFAHLCAKGVELWMILCVSQMETWNSFNIKSNNRIFCSCFRSESFDWISFSVLFVRSPHYSPIIMRTKTYVHMFRIWQRKIERNWIKI